MHPLQSLPLIVFALGAVAAPLGLQGRQDTAPLKDAALRCVAEGLIAGPASNQEAFLDKLCRDQYGCDDGLTGFTVAGAVLLGTCLSCPADAPGASFGGCLLAFASN